MSIELNGASEDTPVIDYTPDFIDESVSYTHLTLPTR